MDSASPDSDESLTISREDGWVAASWVGSAQYCELQVYLEQVGKVEVEKTAAMKQGTETHEQRDREFRKEAEEVDMTLKEASKDAVEREIAVQFSEEFMACPENRVYGIVDRLNVTPERIVAIDFKPKKRRVYDSQRFQALTYALMAETYLGLDLPVHAAIFNRDDPEEQLWAAPLDEHRGELLSKVERLRAVLLEEEPPRSVNRSNKCNKCSLLEDCPDPGT